MNAEVWPWVALALLGAAHGANPAMGWLFAVGRGLQAGDRRLMLASLGPLALGHALAVAAAIVLAATLELAVPHALVRWLAAAALIGLGVAQLRRHHRVRWGGMRIGAAGLTVWSFLMASAHGAGLMAVPVAWGAATPRAHSHAHHAVDAAAAAQVVPAELAAAAVHAAGYLAVTALLAIVVHDRLGLRMLRTAWVNVDLVWAGALIVAGVVTAVG